MKHVLHFAQVVAFVLMSAASNSCAEPKVPPPIASTEEAARISIVRSADPACGTSCPEWISIEGKITAETEGAFRQVMTTMGSQRLPVFIHSGGGLVVASFAIGRMIRAHGLDVVVAKTEIKPCDPKAPQCAQDVSAGILRGEAHSVGAYCASACAFILAAGVHRYAAPWSGIGVHQIIAMGRLIKRFLIVRTTRYMTATQEVVTQKRIIGEKTETRIIRLDRPSARTLGLVRSYLKEMGVSEDLQKLMSETDSKSIHWLTHPEAETTALVTDYFGPENLLAKTAHEAAGPELPVTSMSWGAVDLPGFAAQRVKLLLAFFHRKNSPVVEVNVMIANRGEFPAFNRYGLVMQFGTQKKAPEFVATSRQPSGPLTTTLSVPQFCEALHTDQTLTLRLEDRSLGIATIPFIKGPPGSISAHKLAFMPDLMLDACN